MVNYMSELRVIALERNNDAVLKQLRHTTNTFRHKLVDHVRLLELIMRAVDDQHDTFRDRERQFILDLAKGVFGFQRCIASYILSITVKVHVEIGRLYIAPLELLVLLLILSERQVPSQELCSRWLDHGESREQDDQ